MENGVGQRGVDSSEPMSRAVGCGWRALAWPCYDYEHCGGDSGFACCDCAPEVYTCRVEPQEEASSSQVVHASGPCQVVVAVPCLGACLGACAAACLGACPAACQVAVVSVDHATQAVHPEDTHVVGALPNALAFRDAAASSLARVGQEMAFHQGLAQGAAVWGQHHGDVTGTGCQLVQVGFSLHCEHLQGLFGARCLGPGPAPQ
mmetsp:Transcript_62333/g.143545  ORF Transcript_62333/g.143545 Transcript_62333/m.143545 type:complete len:205 (+) Transcript_62333:1025-1639(+)